MSQAKDILVLNAGSSSLKFALIQMPQGQELASGLAERLGSDQACLTLHWQDQTHTQDLPSGAAHPEALQTVVHWLQLQQVDQNLAAVGHRVVHGGEAFTASTRIDAEVEATIERLIQLAPLHNPANLSGIRSARQLFPDLPQVAVFDTSFHQTLPPEAFTYALPYELYREHGIRRYGFHGTSHRYVTRQAQTWLKPNTPSARLISAHLGNGCSLCAVKGGRALDTTMGLTPLEGLVMGTRSGDLDPSLSFYLVEELGYDLAAVKKLFNRQSGLLGLSGLSNDCRALEEARAQGHERARLALEVFAYRAAKYIASYLVPLGGLEALIFTGGIGENSALVRNLIIQRLGALGLLLDEAANAHCVGGVAGQISQGDRPLALVIPTNEERMIAQDSYELLTTQPSPKPKEIR